MSLNLSLYPCGKNTVSKSYSKSANTNCFNVDLHEYTYLAMLFIYKKHHKNKHCEYMLNKGGIF